MSWYIDSSVIVAQIVNQPSSIPLSKITDENPISSRLAKVEVMRAVRKIDSSLIPRTEFLLSQVQFTEMTESILIRAESYTDEITVKSADSIHLATAETLAPVIEGILTLDKQMAKNAKKLKLTVFGQA